MKKTKHTEPKPKEFAAKPFAALKGVQPVAATPAVTKTVPPAKPPAVAADDNDLFLRAMADVRRVDRLVPAAGTRPPSQPASRPVVRRIDEEERQLFLDTL